MSKHEQFTNEDVVLTFHCTLTYSLNGNHTYHVNETVTALNVDEAKLIAESRHHVSRRTIGSIEPVARLQAALTACEEVEASQILFELPE